MKNDNDFRAQLIKALKLEDSNPAVQEDLLAKAEQLANLRIANALPEILSKEQLEHVDKLRKEGKSESDILGWIEEQIPHFTEMMQALLLDIADELNAFMK
jgi:hypothetical protein